jgi:hypothetical protein
MIFRSGCAQAESLEMNWRTSPANFTLEKRIPETQAGSAGLQ